MSGMPCRVSTKSTKSGKSFIKSSLLLLLQSLATSDPGWWVSIGSSKDEVSLLLNELGVKLNEELLDVRLEVMLEDMEQSVLEMEVFQEVSEVVFIWDFDCGEGEDSCWSSKGFWSQLSLSSLSAMSSSRSSSSPSELELQENVQDMDQIQDFKLRIRNRLPYLLSSLGYCALRFLDLAWW